MPKYVAFDIEIFKEIPPGVSDWHTLRPLGISCAATLRSDGEAITWYNRQDQAQAMTPQQCGDLLSYLLRCQHIGYTVLTWNGCSFDMDILGEEAGVPDMAAWLTLDHVDMMFHFLAVKGYPVGINTVAKTMGLTGKIEGMHGDLAPTMWAAGRYDEVLRYVEQDARTTLEVAEAVTKGGDLIKWTSRAGRYNQERLGPWRTVREALALPNPDTSWMVGGAFLTRAQCVAWLHNHITF